MHAWIGVALIMGMFLVGCGKEDSWDQWTQECMAINKNGQITYCVTGAFNEEYYDLEELTGMAVQEVEKFNGEHKKDDNVPVTVVDISKIGENGEAVRVVYQFDGCKSYSDFVESELYFERLAETFQNQRIYTGTELMGKSESLILDDAAKAKYKERHVIVTDVKTLIHTPYAAQYYSYGVKVLEDGTIDTTGCEDTAIILLKK